MKRLALLCLLTGMTAAAIGQNERMLWGSINGTKNASASAYQKYNNVILLSWRMLPGDDAQTGFDLYRSANGGTETRVNTTPITGSTCFQDTKADRTKTNTYRLTLAGSSQTIGTYTMPAAPTTARLASTT